jgi:hypothetical protein
MLKESECILKETTKPLYKKKSTNKEVSDKILSQRKTPPPPSINTVQ